MSRVKEFELLSITKTSIPSVGSAARERSAKSIHASPRWDGMMTVNQGGCGCTQDFISPFIRTPRDHDEASAMCLQGSEAVCRRGSDKNCHIVTGIGRCDANSRRCYVKLKILRLNN